MSQQLRKGKGQPGFAGFKHLVEMQASRYRAAA
jgi:hypothetical protein